MVAITTLSDIAGQVAKSSLNADKVTVGGICLPAGAIKSIRALIPNNFPKWRDATDDHVSFVVNLAIQQSWSVCAGSLDKTTVAWQSFWKDAREVHSKTASLSGGSIGFLKAGPLIKLLLFCQSSTFTMAHAIKAGTLPNVLDRKGNLSVSESAIFDNEIHGHDNREALEEVWRAINAYQPKLNSLGIHHKVTTLTLASEASEPLLLLPDYIAGIVHSHNCTADTLAASQVTKLAANSALKRLRATRKFYEFEVMMPNSYFEIFPDFKQYSRRD